MFDAYPISLCIPGHPFCLPGWKSTVLNQCCWVFKVVFFFFLKKSRLFFIPCHSAFSSVKYHESLNLKALMEANIVARMKFRY